MLFLSISKNNKTMTDILRLCLPADLITIIKQYTGEIKIRNGIPMRQIPKKDSRYKMLLRRATNRQFCMAIIYEEYGKRGSAKMKTPDKKHHIVISVYKDVIYKDFVWEMNVLGKSVVRLRIV